MTIFSADQVQASTSLQSHLRSLLPLYSHIFLDVPESGAQLLRSSTPSTMKRSKLLTYLPPSLSSRSDGDYIMEMLGSKKKKPLGPEISKLRAIKSDSEREVMRSAADISATAHTKVCEA
jgi:intermediate cleaving peptidase 55